LAPEQSRWWSWRRQRLDRTARGVDDALHSVIALSSAHPSAPLSLLARVPRMLQGMYEGAIHSRIAVRLPAMRRAVWLLASDTAHIPFHACRGTGATERNLLRRTGVSPDHWNELRERILRLCAQPLGAREIRAAVGADEEKTATVITVLAATGELVRVRAPSLFSNTFAFASTEAWLGHSLPSMPRDDALTFLAGDYLQAYGPITVEDFAWWTGIPQPRCEAAITAHEPVSLGNGYLLWAAHARAFEQSRPVANRVNLLPAWDAYPMGYLDRSRFGPPDAVQAVFDRAGNSLPVVLIEGRIGGLWDFKMTRAENLTVNVTLFEDAGARLWETIESEAGAVASLFRARSLSIVRAPRRRFSPPPSPLLETAPSTARAARRGKKTVVKKGTRARTPAGTRATPAKRKPSKARSANVTASAKKPAKRRPIRARSAKKSRAPSKRFRAR
jgi:hypothetical protein